MKTVPAEGWRLAAHFASDPLPPDWRDVLARRLGYRPRRLGGWAELACYGARLCLDRANEPVLPPDACVRICSLSGSRRAMHSSMEQYRMGALMPFTFMQSQPSQMLAALGRCLAWQGDGSIVVARDPGQWQRMAWCDALQAGAAGLLLGQVEEREEALYTEWWRWVPH